VEQAQPPPSDTPAARPPELADAAVAPPPELVLVVVVVALPPGPPELELELVVVAAAPPMPLELELLVVLPAAPELLLELELVVVLPPAPELLLEVLLELVVVALLLEVVLDAQTPLSQVPPVQAVPSGAVGLSHCPLVMLQVPAVWHWSDGVHVTGFEPVHTPAMHASVCSTRTCPMRTAWPSRPR
jgi:hypothetical protein